MVKKFASEGYTVVAVRRKQEKLNEIVSQADENKTGDVIGYPCDVRKEEEVINLIKKVCSFQNIHTKKSIILKIRLKGMLGLFRVLFTI